MTDTYDVVHGWLDRAGRAGGRATVATVRALPTITAWATLKHSPRGALKAGKAIGDWLTERPRTFGTRLVLLGIVAAVALVAAIIGTVIAVTIGMGFGIRHSTTVIYPWLAFWCWAWAVGLGAYGRAGTDDTKTGGRQQQKIAEALAGRLTSVNKDMLDVSQLRREWTDAGTSGRTFTVRLPLWIEASQVAQHRAVIASAIGDNCKADRITVTEGNTPNQAVVFVADKSPSEIPPARWPLENADRHDITKPVPIGVTHAGDNVTMNLFRVNEGKINGGSMLIGGTTDSGKTSFLRLLIAAAALDPRTVIAVADFKGDDDYSGMATALHWHRVRPTEDNVTALGVMLGQVLDHMDAIKRGKADRVPILIVVDEAHAVLGNGGNKAVARQLEMVITQGRSFGVYVILAAQRPTSGAISTDLSANLRDRVCFRVGQQATGEVVVGAQPDDRNPFKFKVTNQGLAMSQLIGYDGKVQTFYVTGENAGRIAKEHPAGEWFATAQETPRAGFPAYADQPQGTGPQDPQGPRTIDLAEVRAAWPEPRDLATCDELVDRMPGGWEPVRLAAAFQAAGIEPRQVSINGNRSTWAIHRDDLTERATDPADTIVDHAITAWPEITDRLTPEHLTYLLAERDPRYAGVTVEAVKAELKAAGVDTRPLKKLDPDDPRRSVRGYLLADLEAVRGGVPG